MLMDIGAQNGILVCPLGFSKSAERMAKKFNIITRTLSLSEANRLNWREIVRIVFPFDEVFHPQMGDGYYIFDSSENVWQTIEALEELPFEEWESMIRNFEQINNKKCFQMLRMIAQLHPDDSWRYNAIRLLDEFGSLDKTLCKIILETENDLETCEYIEELLGTI
jgi:hypothetical protein